MLIHTRTHTPTHTLHAHLHLIDVPGITAVEAESDFVDTAGVAHHLVEPGLREREILISILSIWRYVYQLCRSFGSLKTVCGRLNVAYPSLIFKSPCMFLVVGNLSWVHVFNLNNFTAIISEYNSHSSLKELCWKCIQFVGVFQNNQVPLKEQWLLVLYLLLVFLIQVSIINI